MDAKTLIPTKYINELYLIKSNYEGIDYYQLVATTSWGHKLKVKLNLFEYNTLKEKYKNV